MNDQSMPEKMRRFLAKPPRRVREPSRSYPRGWLTDCVREQRNKCHYCGGRMKRQPLPDEWHMRATIDHVVPLSAGGENKRKNVVAACIRCNQEKGSMSEAEFRQVLYERRKARWT